ncbi:MAG: 50S ribosomal protein L24 [Lachnospiraceae bacterium]|nr:50S ribosomal protein L24 [Lachnospiraceae bacterium]
MATSKIKKGDQVVVIAGKNKGEKGTVVSVKNDKVIVEGVNKVKKHAKPSQANPNGGIIEMEAPIDISNVMYLSNNTPSRIGFEMKDGKKVRVAKATGEVID